MTRQYIGARYVPKFSDVNDGVWSSDFTYEAMEIVKHGNDWYTSKKPVPTGIDISDSEYWVLTGNYNGAISHLQDEIDNISSEIAAMGDTIVTPEMFGAVGDGVTDDTAAVQDAMNSGSICLLISSYKVNKITLTKAAVIKGNKTGKLLGSANSSGTTNTIIETNYDLIIEDVWFAGLGSSTSEIKACTPAIISNNASWVRIRNCVFTGFYNTYSQTVGYVYNFDPVLLKIIDSSVADIENNSFSGSSGNELVVISPKTKSVNYNTIVNFNNNRMLSLGGASFNIFGYDVNIKNNLFFNCNYNGSAFNYGGYKVTIRDNVFDARTVYGEIFDCVEGGRLIAHDVTIENNTVYGRGEIFANICCGKARIANNHAVCCKAMLIWVNCNNGTAITPAWLDNSQIIDRQGIDIVGNHFKITNSPTWTTVDSIFRLFTAGQITGKYTGGQMKPHTICNFEGNVIEFPTNETINNRPSILSSTLCEVVNFVNNRFVNIQPNNYSGSVTVINRLQQDASSTHTIKKMLLSGNTYSATRAGGIYATLTDSATNIEKLRYVYNISDQALTECYPSITDSEGV